MVVLQWTNINVSVPVMPYGHLSQRKNSMLNHTAAMCWQNTSGKINICQYVFFFHLEWGLFLLAVCSSIDHILDHVLTYGIETERVTVFPENPPWSDHFLITFALTIMNYKAVGNPFHYSRCLSESALANFNSSAVIFLNVPPQWIPLPLRSVIVIVLHLYSLRLDTVAYLKTKPQSVLFI